MKVGHHGSLKGCLRVDLSRIRENYARIKSIVGNEVQVAAVVKKNAYGLGAVDISSTLLATGCRVFYTDSLSTAIVLRKELGRGPSIFSFRKPSYESFVGDYSKFDILPIASCPRDVECLVSNRDLLSLGIMLDVGFGSLGLPCENVGELLAMYRDFLFEREIVVMGHLSASFHPDSPVNRVQRDLFSSTCEYIESEIGSVRRSLASSSGVLLGEDYYFDQVRCGAALFGFRPNFDSNPFASAVTAVSYIREVKRSSGVTSAGYTSGERNHFQAGDCLGVVEHGFADGIPRNLDGWNVLIRGQMCRVIGSTSMSRFCVRVLDAWEFDGLAVHEVEIFGSSTSLEGLCDLVGSIPHEIVLNLSKSFDVEYI